MVRFQAKVGDFFLLQNPLTDAGTHAVSYSVDTVAVSPGIKRKKREGTYSPSPSAEDMNEWSSTSTLHIVF